MRLHFSVFLMLASVGAIALLLLPVSHYVRSRMAIPDFIESAVAEVGSYAPDSSAIYQSLLNDLEIRELRSIRNSPDPLGRLRKSLLITTSGEPGMLQIVAIGNREDVEPDELRKLCAATIEIIREDVKKSGMAFFLVSTSTAVMK
jgi:hypothetical protein